MENTFTLSEVDLYLLTLSDGEMDNLADSLAKFEEGLIEDEELTPTATAE